MALYTDSVFAPIDLDHSLERLAGGNETEVYRSDDGQWVIKLKTDLGGSIEAATLVAQHMREAAEQFAECLGPRHTISSEYLVTRDAQGHAQVLVVQPFLRNACPLDALDYSSLSRKERANISSQLRSIIDRSLRFYRRTGSMPDLYGRTSTNSEERRRNNTLLRAPHRLWSFLVERTMLRSHNLMYTADGRVVLVDYDIVRRSRLYRFVYYAIRWMLFWRDHMLIDVMRKGGGVLG